MFHCPLAGVLTGVILSFRRTRSQPNTRRMGGTPWPQRPGGSLLSEHSTEPGAPHVHDTRPLFSTSNFKLQTSNFKLPTSNFRRTPQDIKIAIGWHSRLGCDSQAGRPCHPSNLPTPRCYGPPKTIHHSKFRRRRLARSWSAFRLRPFRGSVRIDVSAYSSRTPNNALSLTTNGRALSRPVSLPSNFR